MFGLVKKVFKNKKTTETLTGDSKISNLKKGSCLDCCGCGDGCGDGCGSGCGNGCCGCC